MEISQLRKVCLDDTREISPNVVPQKGQVFCCFSHLPKSHVVVHPQLMGMFPIDFPYSYSRGLHSRGLNSSI